MKPSNLESRVEPVVEESIKKIRLLGGGGTTMAAAPDFVHELRVITIFGYPLVVLH